MATFVLIPGGFTGSWIWQPVTTLLRAAGHTVYPVTVTGLGERVHLATPEIGLDTHIQDIVNVLIYEDLHDVILAGWSYGATLAACVAHRAPARIQHVVYVDGDPPKDGQSALDRMMPDERAMVEERFRTEGDGFRIPPRTGAYPEMIPDTALRAWVIDRLTPDGCRGLRDRRCVHRQRLDHGCRRHQFPSTPATFGAYFYRTSLNATAPTIDLRERNGY